MALIAAKRALLGRATGWCHPKAAWAANFRAGLYGPEGGVTVTRSSDHMLADASGIIRTFGPDTLARADGIGAYIGGQVTNAFTNSAHFSTWKKNNVDLMSAEVAPNGDAATLCRPTTAVNIHRIFQIKSVVIGSVYATSICAKAGGYRYLALNGSTANGAVGVFDLQDGKATFDLGTGGMEPLANGWWRCWTIGVAQGTSGVGDGFPYVQVHKEFSNATSAWNFAGDGVSGIYLWGGQFEPKFLTPPAIISGATAATRLASDVSAASFGWYGTAGLDASGCSVLVAANVSHVGDSVVRPLTEVSDGTANNRLRLYIDADDKLAAQVISGGATVATAKLATALGVGRTGIAARFDPASGLRIVARGIAGAGTSLASLPSGLNRLALGSGAGGNYFNDLIEQAQICKPLMDGEMDAWATA